MQIAHPTSKLLTPIRSQFFEEEILQLLGMYDGEDEEIFGDVEDYDGEDEEIFGDVEDYDDEEIFGEEEKM